MLIENLRLFNYRNYESLKQSFSASFNVLIGMNAQGKTNLIEAIHYLSTGRSYRPVRDMQLIKWGNNFFIIDGFIKNNLGKIQVEIVYKKELPNSPNSKEIKINGVKKNKITELLGCFNTVLFSPEDLNIIKGAPSERRKLLDSDISQVNPGYYQKLLIYNRIVAQRNHTLRRIVSKKATKEELAAWNCQFLESSRSIIEKRLEVLEKLVPLTRLMQRKLTNGEENIEIKYLLGKEIEIKKNSDIDTLLLEEINKKREEELIKGITLSGPHRDDILFMLNGMNLKYYGSQGQHRTAVLALKLAELEFFKAETGEFPVLLLDDVLSELDSTRREHLIRTIINKEIQCFITTTEDLPVEINKTIIKRFIINKGKLDSI